MNFFIRYTGERGGNGTPASRRELVQALQIAMPQNEVWKALTAIEQGQRITTRKATFYSTHSAPPTEAEYTAMLQQALARSTTLQRAG